MGTLRDWVAALVLTLPIAAHAQGTHDFGENFATGAGAGLKSVRSVQQDNTGVGWVVAYPVVNNTWNRFSIGGGTMPGPPGASWMNGIGLNMQVSGGTTDAQTAPGPNTELGWLTLYAFDGLTQNNVLHPVGIGFATSEQQTPQNHGQTVFIQAIPRGAADGEYEAVIGNGALFSPLSFGQQGRYPGTVDTLNGVFTPEKVSDALPLCDATWEGMTYILLDRMPGEVARCVQGQWYGYYMSEMLGPGGSPAGPPAITQMGARQKAGPPPHRGTFPAGPAPTN